MFDRILVFLLVVCGVVFLWLTLGEANKSNTLNINDTTNISTTDDINQDSYSNELQSALLWANNLGITSFSNLTDFRPNDYITRGEFAKMITTYIASKNTLATNERNADCLFHDFQDAGEFSLYVYDACSNGLMYGSQNRFYPQNALSRAEAIAAIVRHMGGNMNQVADPWYTNYVNYAAEQGLIDNNNLGAMEQKMVRFEALILLRRAQDSRR